VRQLFHSSENCRQFAVYFLLKRNSLFVQVDFDQNRLLDKNVKSIVWMRLELMSLNFEGRWHLLLDGALRGDDVPEAAQQLEEHLMAVVREVLLQAMLSESRDEIQERMPRCFR
jgi:autotransporter translocation and assembly factor TamB